MSDLHSSPKARNKSPNIILPSIDKPTEKDKNYLPSRYAHDLNPVKTGFHEVLNSIEVNLKGMEADKNTILPSSPAKNSQIQKRSPNFRTRKEPTQHKLRPLKRQESDFQNFKQIFLDPKIQILDHIKETGYSQQLVYAKRLCKDYERLLQFEIGKQSKQGKEEISDSEVTAHFNECIEILEKNEEEVSKVSESDFYEQQMRIEPPDMPNSSMGSTLSPGGGYAPSIPLSLNGAGKKAKLTQLLMRAKAGTSTEDIKKQAHLSFYLGVVYEQKRQYHSALRFYRRFLGFAKALEDKIGMCLGANRVAISYYYIGDASKSINFHNQNLKLSDNENCFAAYYNLGICHRCLGKNEESLEYFETALQWANQSGEADSECITLGQMGITYKNMELYQSALDHLQKSVQICRKLKKTKLQQLNILNILLIASKFHLKSQEAIEELSEEAYECTKMLEERRMQEILSCNIGIIKGMKEFEGQSKAYPPEYEPLTDSIKE